MKEKPELTPFFTAEGRNIRQANLKVGGNTALANMICGLTNIGKGREKNQDAIGVRFYFKENRPCLMLAVADGLGYYENSECSACDAVTRIPERLCESYNPNACFLEFHNDLLRAFPYRVKHRQTKEESCKNNAAEDDRGSTTLVLAKIFDNTARISNVGDSRACLIRNGKMIFRTRDQTAIELLISQGMLEDNPAVLRRHPLRSVLLNSLGSPEPTYKFEEEGKIVVKKSGLPVVDDLNLEEGDCLLLATDGFYTNFSEELLCEIIVSTPWKKLGKTLDLRIKEVLKKGRTASDQPCNPDNYSFIVYRHLVSPPSS